ncbi:hypothetical protein H6P81_014182 [Aristolochia fimbriata]|uniref:Ribosomal protein S21 n=1 Tax=Aristolochia fimbriata TaxID=158543 RepID=A0AAV7EHA0_ARIFI|nr:hypothetical protein H6P81_014182 [Aristolochia fimbriata]
MNAIARRFSAAIFRRPEGTGNGVVALGALSQPWNQQSQRGIRVFVKDGNLEQALSFMTRRMVESGVERLIVRQTRHHVKNSEKRVLARKRLQNRIRRQDFARKLKTILINKVRGL